MRWKKIAKCRRKMAGIVCVRCTHHVTRITWRMSRSTMESTGTRRTQTMSHSAIRPNTPASIASSFVHFSVHFFCALFFSGAWTHFSICITAFNLDHFIDTILYSESACMSISYHWIHSGWVRLDRVRSIPATSDQFLVTAPPISSPALLSLPGWTMPMPLCFDSQTRICFVYRKFRAHLLTAQPPFPPF